MLINSGKKKVSLIIIFLFLITPIYADVSPWDYTAPTNYSTVNTNNSVYWNGYAWSDTRWRTFDNHTINGDLLVNGGLNITTTNTQINTGVLDVTGDGAGYVPTLEGIGSVYNIIALQGGIIVDFKTSFPYGILFRNDEDNDNVTDNQISFEWDITNNILKLIKMAGGGTTDFSVDGEIYANSTHKVCTSENGLCNQTITDYNSTGLIKDWNSTGYIQNWNSSGYIQNWSAVIDTGDNLWVNESSVATYNGTINVRGDIQIKNKKTIEVDDDGTVNFYGSI